MLSENQICGICNLDEGAFVDGCCPTATDNCDRFQFGKLIALNMHKADLEDFQKQKQEMWNDLCKHLEDVEEDITDLEELKHKWGIE